MYWVHEDAITKSQRTTDVYGAVTPNGVVELDPWGANTDRSSPGPAFQPHQISGYTKDGNGDQDAMARRYSPTGRFSQPDPYSGSYDFSDPQSLNRYAYVGNDPVNKRDPSGMEPALCMLDGSPINCGTMGMFINSGAGVLGPIRTVKWNPNSDGYGTAGFDTYRAVGHNAGWFNVHGVLITVDAYINGQWAGSATPVFQSFATRSFGGNPFVEVDNNNPLDGPVRTSTNKQSQRGTNATSSDKAQRDCIDRAIRQYVGDQLSMAALGYGAWTAMGFVSLGLVYTRGAVELPEMFHLWEGRSGIVAAYAPLVAGVGNAAKQHVVNYRALQAAVRDCRNH